MITQAKKLELIHKHGKKFAAKSNARAILKGIHYHESGEVYVTDSVQLLRIHNAHNFGKSITSDARTGTEIDGTYPGVSKVFPNRFEYETVLRGEQIIDAIKKAKLNFDIAKVADENKSNLCSLSIRNGVVSLLVNSQVKSIQSSIYFGTTDSADDLDIYFNAEFLHNAMQVFKDAGSEEIKIHLIDKTRPILMSDEKNEIEVLWMPIRLPA